MSTTSSPSVAADHGDVDVEPLVPGHPDPVGDLGERRGGRHACTVRLSRSRCAARAAPAPRGAAGGTGRLGTPWTRVPAAVRAETREVEHAGGPQARRPPGDRRGLRRDRGAGRLQGARRAAPARRQPGHRAQRHGHPRGRGLHHPAAHQRRPGPDRQGLPAVRRPAHHRQADEPRRAARHLDLPRRRRRPRRRRDPVGAAAVAADPSGRRRAVPHALPLDGPARRARRAGAQPAARRADPELGPGRAAGRRAVRAADRRGARATCARPSAGRPPGRSSPTR